MKTTVGYNIYLPPSYSNPGDTNRYPVVYWLHGKGGDENSHVWRAPALDRAIRSQALPEFIHVWVSGGAETFYSDSYDGKWMAETTIIKELIPHIDSTWRTRAERGKRAIQGMSMGGFGAMRLGLKHPEMFSSIVAFAGGYRDAKLMAEPNVKSSFEKMFNNDPSILMLGHPFKTAKSNAVVIRGGTAIKLFCGSKDYLLEPNRRMHQALTDAGINHEYDEVPDIDHDFEKYAAWIGLGNYEFAVLHFGTPNAASNREASR